MVASQKSPAGKQGGKKTKNNANHKPKQKPKQQQTNKQKTQKKSLVKDANPWQSTLCKVHMVFFMILWCLPARSSKRRTG